MNIIAPISTYRKKAFTKRSTKKITLRKPDWKSLRKATTKFVVASATVFMIIKGFFVALFAAGCLAVLALIYKLYLEIGCIDFHKVDHPITLAEIINDLHK